MADRPDNADDGGSSRDDDDGSAPAKSWPPRTGPLRLLREHELAFVLATTTALLIAGVWSYTLVDPWETHYGEVARRMLEDSDWVQLKWQNENFDSKPVLTFWFMAAGLKLFGLASEGGYSGELATSGLTNIAIRLPFVLTGVFGLTITWWMLARLASRRVAWLAVLILGTTPFYFFVARQGITDLPMVACLMGSVACIAMIVATRDGPPSQVWRRFNSFHIFLAFLLVVGGGQLLYFAIYFAKNPSIAAGLRLPSPMLTLVVPFTLVLVAFVVATTWWKPVVRQHTVYMLWLFALMGISILGKGPPAAAIIVLIAVFYVALARRWDLALSWATWADVLRGLIVMVIIAIPWHVAIFLKQGLRWVNVYLRTHIMQRAFKGVHGDRGTFDYYVSQLGIGMWPWIALLPGALATVLAARIARTSEGNVRLLIGTWAVVGFALFAAVQTKFHHYALPVVPGLAILIAFFLDDLLSGTIRRSSLYMILAAAITLVICRDLIFEHKQFIELFVYRHDRPWPDGAPWVVDLTTPLLAFGITFAALMLLLPSKRLRRYTMPGLAVVAVAFALWASTGYMRAAAPHWGQRALHETYYAQRSLHGVEIEYYSLRDLADQWRDQRDIEVRSALPEGFSEGQQAHVVISVPGADIKDDRLTMIGKVSSIGDDSFRITVSDEEKAKLAPLVERGQEARPSKRRPRSQVDADRLIAWQLNWRGENFWSGGEIWGPFPSTQTVFMKTDNVAFLAYLNKVATPGRRYFVITEAQRAKNLKSILPTQSAKDTVTTLDTSNNKFSLLSFTL